MIHCVVPWPDLQVIMWLNCFVFDISTLIKICSWTEPQRKKNPNENQQAMIELDFSQN